MSTKQTLRPDFFEGQYLGSGDLDSAVGYTRFSMARHSLGGHTWGIAAGLSLTEEKLGDTDAVDVVLQPGYAWDGFGRPIVVLAPYRLPLALFESLPYNAGAPDGYLVDVWIQYEENRLRSPAPGFEPCDVDDTYSRVQENYRVEVGPRLKPRERRDKVDVHAQHLDPSRVPQHFENRTPPLVLHDESVPYQCFPEAKTKDRWLIPVGAVRWRPSSGPGVSSELAARDKDQTKESRKRRRYIGSVAREVLSPADTLHFRRRMKEPSSVQSTDFAWVEGGLRVDGNARLFGGYLELRTQDGKTAGSTLRVSRRDKNPLGGNDLRAVIGQRGKRAGNRFVVGPLKKGKKSRLDPQLVVTDGGQVGIREPKPTYPLSIRPLGDSEELVAFLDPNGKKKWHINQLFQGRSGLNFVESGQADGRLYIEAGGKVGISTTQPKFGLHVARSVHKGFSVGMGGDSGRISTEYLRNAPSLVFFDFDDGGSIRFRQGADEENPTAEAIIAARDGSIAIGTDTPAPGNQAGALRIQTPSGRVDVGSKNTGFSHFYTDRDRYYFNKDVWVNGDIGAYRGDLHVFTNTSGFTKNRRISILDDDGQVGIGVTNPVTRLHVRHNITANANNLDAHVAVIENQGGDNADVLALRVGDPIPTSSNNFITFFAGGLPCGRFEGVGTFPPTVIFMPAGADYAEWLPRRNAQEELEAGDVVGLHGGAVTRETRDADLVLVVSEAPAVCANATTRERQQNLEMVAFMGQVKIKVRGPVRAGDYLVPSGDGDGLAVAYAFDELPADAYADVLGMAWETCADEEDVRKARAVIGLPGAMPWGRWLAAAIRKETN